MMHCGYGTALQEKWGGVVFVFMSEPEPLNPKLPVTMQERTMITLFS